MAEWVGMQLWQNGLLVFFLICTKSLVFREVVFLVIT